MKKYKQRISSMKINIPNSKKGYEEHYFRFMGIWFPTKNKDNINISIASFNFKDVKSLDVYIYKIIKYQKNGLVHETT